MVTEINDFDAMPRKFEINCDNRAVVAITDRDNRQNTRRLADQTRSRFQSVPRRLCHGRVPGKTRLRPAREQTFHEVYEGVSLTKKHNKNSLAFWRQFRNLAFAGSERSSAW